MIFAVKFALGNQSDANYIWRIEFNILVINHINTFETNGVICLKVDFIFIGGQNSCV